MRFGVIGRTKVLIEAAQLLVSRGHELCFVHTCKPESYYGFEIKEYREFASKMGVPFYADLSINMRTDKLSRHGAEVCISANWKTLLSEELMNIFPHGILNAHGGDLPRYRGNACINWAIINSERMACMCIHRMVSELDAGPVYLKEYFLLDEQTYVGDYYSWSESVVPEMFYKAVDKITKGIEPTPQNESIVPLRCYPRKPEDSRINWGSAAKDIHALIRASSHPFEGAFCFTEKNQCIRIFRAVLYKPKYEFCAIPGQVCFIDKGIAYMLWRQIHYGGNNRVFSRASKPKGFRVHNM